MRYHYIKPEHYYPIYGRTYSCDHPVYNQCTLFEINKLGLAVIQQRYCDETKHTWWGPIDENLRNELYLHPGFHKVFMERSRFQKEGLYPTITVRQLMWALRMKPLKRQRWETCFDKRDI